MGASWILESTPGRLVACDIRSDGSAGPRRVLAELPGTVPDGIAFATDGSIVIACYRPDIVYRWSSDLGLEVLAEDPEGTVVAAPTNCAFTGPDLATISCRTSGAGTRPASGCRGSSACRSSIRPPTSSAKAVRLRERPGCDRDAHRRGRGHDDRGTAPSTGHLRRLGHDEPRVRARACPPRAGTRGLCLHADARWRGRGPVRKTIAAIYVGAVVEERERTFTLAWRRSLASHAAGIGLRALSIVDLACWDLAARLADRSIADLLGGRNLPMPATAIDRLPTWHDGPGRDGRPDGRALRAGLAPLQGPHGRCRRALRGASPRCPSGRPGRVARDGRRVGLRRRRDGRGLRELDPDVGLGWFEDVFPPGDAGKLRALRRRTDVPIAMGDEQGGIYYPEALILAEAVDVVRVDLTCMGGITAGRRIIDQVLDAGLAFAPHMFPHVHSQVMAAWGFDDVPMSGASRSPASTRWTTRCRSRSSLTVAGCGLFPRSRASDTSSTPTGSAASHMTTPTGYLDGL